MEELFRSLSESVSEDCFDEIMGIVEEEIKKYRTGLADSTIDSLISKRKRNWNKAMTDQEEAERKAGMQPFVAYPVVPKKVEKAIKAQHKAFDKLRKTKDMVSKIRNDEQ